MQEIKNLVLDLGGVLIDIDVSLTNKAFENLGIPHFQQYYTLAQASPLFEELETGRIDKSAFYTALRALTNTLLSDTEIEQAWNALLLHWRKESVDWLIAARKKYKLVLFSNTNAVHYDCFQSYFTKQTNYLNFNDLFDSVWYSFQKNLRKPYVSSFRALMQEEGLAPSETLFIDDTLVNIEGAKEAGMKVCHLPATIRLEQLGLV